jgi:Platelet-activating factor acetylhydrolase, isoform II
MTPSPARQRRKLLYAFVPLALLVATSSASATQVAARAPTLRLPALSGREPVGTRVLRLVDRSRPDRSFRSGYRELMVQLWYPAASRGAGFAPYLPLRIAKTIERTYHLPNGIVAQIRTHARSGAAVARGAHPVLLYSPGSSEMRSDATALVEDLASEGFVVVAIDHTHEGQLVEFPDGRLVRGTFVDTGPASNLRALRVRVADSRFVLDQLPVLDGRGAFAGRLELDRVGMLGFSLGGATAAATMLADPRVKAGADLDGSLYGRVAHAGLRRPFLLMLSPIPAAFKKRCGARCRGLSEFQFFRRFYSHSTGPRFAVELEDSGHESFEDSVWIKPELASVDPAVAAQFDVGTIGATNAVAAVSGYLTAFFERYLRGEGTTVLSNPSRAYPALRPLP